jgi:hypothetical protein
METFYINLSINGIFLVGYYKIRQWYSICLFLWGRMSDGIMKELSKENIILGPGTSYQHQQYPVHSLNLLYCRQCIYNIQVYTFFSIYNNKLLTITYLTDTYWNWKYCICSYHKMTEHHIRNCFVFVFPLSDHESHASVMF